MNHEQSPDDQLKSQLKDEAFREQMSKSKDTDPAAAEWIKKDESAQRKEARLDAVSHEIVKRKNLGLNVHETEQLLSEAQDARDAFLSSGRPSLFALKERAAFDKKALELKDDVASYQKQFVEMVRKSSPEEIEVLQNRMEKRHNELQETIKERQGIALLPSEVAAKQSQKQEGQVRDRPLPMQDQIDRSLNSWTPDTRLEGREKQEDLNWARQLEADQIEMRKRLGRAPNNDEMTAYQDERAQQLRRQAQRSGQTQ